MSRKINLFRGRCRSIFELSLPEFAERRAPRAVPVGSAAGGGRDGMSQARRPAAILVADAAEGTGQNHELAQRRASLYDDNDTGEAGYTGLKSSRAFVQSGSSRPTAYRAGQS